MQEGQTQSEQPNWQFTPEDDVQVVNNAQPVPPASITWSASEYVAHHKGSGWYVGFTMILAIIAAVVYLFTRDMVSTVVIAVIGVAFAIFAGRQPNVLDYAVDNTGIHIGSRTYPYNMFKSFSVVNDGAIRSISLLPMQRFMPPISIYYEPQDEEKIVTALSDHLPIAEGGNDFVDRLMKRIRF